MTAFNFLKYIAHTNQIGGQGFAGGGGDIGGDRRGGSEGENPKNKRQRAAAWGQPFQGRERDGGGGRGRFYSQDHNRVAWNSNPRRWAGPVNSLPDHSVHEFRPAQPSSLSAATGGVQGPSRGFVHSQQLTGTSDTAMDVDGSNSSEPKIVPFWEDDKLLEELLGEMVGISLLLLFEPFDSLNILYSNAIFDLFLRK